MFAAVGAIHLNAELLAALQPLLRAVFGGKLLVSERLLALPIVAVDLLMMGPRQTVSRVQRLPTRGRHDARLLCCRQSPPGIAKFLAALGKLLGRTVSFQASFGVCNLTFHRQQLVSARGQFPVQLFDALVARVPPGLQGCGAKLIVTRLNPYRAAAPPVVGISFCGDPCATTLLAGTGAGDASQIFQLPDQPSRHLRAESKLREQGCRLCRRRSFVSHGDIVAVALTFSQFVGLDFVR